MTNDEGIRFIRQFARFWRRSDGVLSLPARLDGLAILVREQRGRPFARSISFRALLSCTCHNEGEILSSKLHRPPRNSWPRHLSHTQQVAQSIAGSLECAESYPRNRSPLLQTAPFVLPDHIPVAGPPKHPHGPRMFHPRSRTPRLFRHS